jgi:hypothetical protein
VCCGQTTLDVALDAIVIYPNPSNGTFTINNSNQMYSIEVYSIIGQKIFSAENTTKSEITTQILLEEPTWFASVPIRNHKKINNQLKKAQLPLFFFAQNVIKID